MPDETLRAFITRRRRELENQLTAARGTVSAIEFQLTELDQAEKALPPDAMPAGLFSPLPEGIANIPPAVSNAAPTQIPVPGAYPSPLAKILAESYAQRTIKQLVMSALRDRHPMGLKTSDLRNFIRDAYGRSIDANSLRPQLARLKDENWIDQNPAGAWCLTKMGSKYQYQHLSLNMADEPPEESAPSASGEKVTRRERWYGNPPPKDENN